MKKSRGRSPVKISPIFSTWILSIGEIENILSEIQSPYYYLLIDLLIEIRKGIRSYYGHDLPSKSQQHSTPLSDPVLIDILRERKELIEVAEFLIFLLYLITT